MADPSASGRRLLVFVRTPRMGEGMPLVSARLGEEEGFRLQVLLLRRTLQVASDVEAERWLLHTPDHPSPRIPLGWRALAQGTGPMGERLGRAFERAFSEGSGPVVAIDMECPALTPPLLTHAFELLERQSELVIGPSERGGYYLLGLRRPHSSLFRSVPFGSSGLFRATLDRAISEGLSPSVLPRLGNVEGLADWERESEAGWLEGPRPRG